MKRVIPLLICLLLAVPAFGQWSDQVGDFTVEFLGVQYDGTAGTSTWSYRVTWNGTPPELSHFTIGICETASVISTSPGGAIVGVDGSLLNNMDCSPTTLYGVKWEVTIPANTPTVFSFTLDGTYAVGSTRFAAKASTNCNLGEVYGPSCDIADPGIDVTKSCTPNVFVGDDVSYTITVENSGNVTLTSVRVIDSMVGLDETIAELAAGASQTFNVSVPAPDDSANPNVVNNTVSVSGNYFGWIVTDSESCSTSVWRLGVSKDATTTYTRDYDWTISKEADPAQAYPRDETTRLPILDICGGQTADLDFEICVERSATDSDWAVSGTITIANPAPMAATLASVTDVISESIDATVSCSTFLVPAEGSITCSYSATLPNADQRVNTATATLSNNYPFSGTADVIFGDPTTVLDASVTVSDVVSCPDGFTCTADDEWVFTDSGCVTVTMSIANDGAMCDTWYDLTNVVSLTDDDATVSASAAAQIYSCSCSFGCTLTIGYWKTHAGFHGNNEDRVTQYLPVLLGDGGAATLSVDDAAEAVSVLSMELGHPSNGITKLYAQLLAAKLNIANGADGSDISDEIAAADDFLGDNGLTAWDGLSKSMKKWVNTLMSTFDIYNNGLIGPGHCD